jgi:hypothetical protein
MESDGGTVMISRLVRIEFESYLHDLVVWGGTVFFFLVLFLSFMGMVVARSGDSFSNYLSDLFLLSLGLSSVLLAVKVSGRNAIEKRTRLFSQLPVSTREVSFASWCVRLLCLSIPTLAFSVFLARAANMRFATFALVTLATYLGGTTLVAAISVGMSIRHLPSPMAAWANGVYVACAIVAVVVWFIGNLLVFPRFPSAAIGGLGLPGLIGCLMVSAVGLVVVDVWLRDRLDDYLG